VEQDPAQAVTFTVGERDRELADLLDERIYAFNVAATGRADGRLISIRAEDGAGRLVGGLSGWAWGGCGYVDVLWVADDHRHQGIGTRLMDAAEAVALASGCVLMVLSTHTFQAPGFYQRRGYIEIGRTPNYPQGHAELHMSKTLTDTNLAD
jgi:GNAT superfamily N-acetyltransferase